MAKKKSAEKVACKEIVRDCFANQKGRCTCLIDTNFGGKCCPFYKSREVIDREQIEMDCIGYARRMGEDCDD